MPSTNPGKPPTTRITGIILLSLALMLGLAGCGAPGGKAGVSDEELKTMALEFLQERYGTYFQVVKVARDTLFGGTPHGVVVTSLDHPECDEFTVHWDRQWWHDTFDDTYLYCPMQEHYEAMVAHHS